MNLCKGSQLYSQAKKIIPGGTQLLSKRPEMFLPELWPAYYSRCSGVEVWDLDGNRYIDASICGVGACVLGYCDGDVDAAVADAIRKGTMCTLNCPEEVELAGLLCELHPWAEMVRFAAGGGEAMAVAVRIARAFTGREKVLFCGYHGWHDWYLSANLADDKALDGHLLGGLEPNGVPRCLKGTALPFYYNDLAGFEELVNKHKGDIAAVVLEPVRDSLPESGFLESIREITGDKKIVLILDEITSGFRMNTGGIHLTMGIEPDIAVFAKAISNGYPMAAVIGKGSVMSAAQRTFISSTYWTNRIGPAAALATIRKHKENEVGSHLIRIGDMVQQGWRSLAKKYSLYIDITGISPLGHWRLRVNNSRLIHTLIVKEMLERGFLTSGAFYASYAHKKGHIDGYISALDEVFGQIEPHIKDNTVECLYNGPLAHKGFERLA